VRAAIYARVSTNDKRQEVENQLPALREFIQREGWGLAVEYVDEQTGRTNDRPSFKQMFKDAAKGKFDVLVFWSLDRFSREGAARTILQLESLSEMGVKYRSLTEPYLNSLGMWGDAIIAVLATIAKQESIRLGERTKAGLDRARKEGKQIGRPGTEITIEDIAVAVDEIELTNAANGQPQRASIRQIAARLGCSPALIHKLRKKRASQ
jgi:DNA invertase Pin-like site-specific DNA recombinase